MFSPRSQRPRRQLLLNSQEWTLSKEVCSGNQLQGECQPRIPFSPIVVTWPAWKEEVAWQESTRKVVMLWEFTSLRQTAFWPRDQGCVTPWGGEGTECIGNRQVLQRLIAQKFADATFPGHSASRKVLYKLGKIPQVSLSKGQLHSEVMGGSLPRPSLELQV